MTDKNTHQHATHAAEPAAAKGPWWKNKRAQLAFKILGALFAFAFISWVIFYFPYAATDDARVDAHTIKVANLGASGLVMKIYVKEGDKVTAGQILAELDHATAEANLSKSRAAANFAAMDLKRTRAIASQQGLSQQSVDKSEQLGAITQADLKLMEIALERTYLKSPVDGIVIQKTAEEGNVLEGNQSAFMVADTEHAWVSAYILEKAVKNVKLGQTVYVSVDEGGKLTGKIADIRRASASVFSLIPSDNAAGNFTKVEQRIPIKVELEPHPGIELRVGQSVEIRIRIR
jgi:multidrug resistance efflux pump